MLRARFHKYTLHFRFLARTSRESMTQRHTYYLHLWDDSNPEVEGIGECNLFRGLSAEDTPDYERRLQRFCDEAGDAHAVDNVRDCSSILFGFETAKADLNNGGVRQPFPCQWSIGGASIPINGLVWMGDRKLMADRIREKLDAGFKCLKLKIGGIRFEDELDLLEMVRREFSQSDLQIRLDANGAFSPADALEKLDRLSKYSIHSIEQPIRAGQLREMSELCKKSPLPIALDEELIGVREMGQKAALLDGLRPQYIILKPALCGGFCHADEWIAEAQRLGIGWWSTSALESNVGLNAIAQWLGGKMGDKGLEMPQGLGTGALYVDNVQSPLKLEGDRLLYDASVSWGRIP